MITNGRVPGRVFERASLELTEHSTGRHRVAGETSVARRGVTSTRFLPFPCGAVRLAGVRCPDRHGAIGVVPPSPGAGRFASPPAFLRGRVAATRGAGGGGDAAEDRTADRTDGSSTAWRRSARGLVAAIYGSTLGAQTPAARPRLSLSSNLTEASPCRAVRGTPHTSTSLAACRERPHSEGKAP